MKESGYGRWKKDEIAQKNGVMPIPMLKMFFNGREVRDSEIHDKRKTRL